jgi:hypothetical protein
MAANDHGQLVMQQWAIFILLLKDYFIRFSQKKGRTNDPSL